jgi:geranylgeranyl pyrophosphate synthase
MAFCCEVAPILAGSSLEVRMAMREVGLSLGLAFQFVDDAIDFNSDQISGKDTQKDLENHIINSVTFELFAIRPDLFSIWKESPDQYRSLFKNGQAQNDLNTAKMRILERSNREIERSQKSLLFVLNSLTLSHEKERALNAYNSLVFLMDFLTKRDF